MLRFLSIGLGKGCHLHATDRKTESQGGAVTACPATDYFCDIAHTHDVLGAGLEQRTHQEQQPALTGMAQWVECCPAN